MIGAVYHTLYNHHSPRSRVSPHYREGSNKGSRSSLPIPILVKYGSWSAHELRPRPNVMGSGGCYTPFGLFKNPCAVLLEPSNTEIRFNQSITTLRL
jgi:hypothetical protein